MAKKTKHLEAYLTESIELLTNNYKGICVACSGGLDSTVLFHCLFRHLKGNSNIKLSISHINYSLRGKESLEDEAFVKKMAEDHQVPLFVFSPNKTSKSDSLLKNTQAWARDYRYKKFKELSKKGWLIAVGHHQKDIAENIIFRLSRGVSAHNLVGMKVYNKPVWRPFLFAPHQSIEEWAKRHKLPHREDSSNVKMAYSRNVIRHKVLSELEKIFPGSTGKIAQTGFDIVNLLREQKLDKMRLSKKHKSLAIRELTKASPENKLCLISSLILENCEANKTHTQLSRSLLNDLVNFSENKFHRGAIKLPNSLGFFTKDKKNQLTIKKNPPCGSRFLQHKRLLNDRKATFAVCAQGEIESEFDGSQKIALYNFRKQLRVCVVNRDDYKP